MTLPVSQEAREAAADYIEAAALDPGRRNGVRNGECDDYRIVQAFARFESTIREQCAKVADYGVERAARDWRLVVAQDAVKQVCFEVAEVIRYGPIPEIRKGPKA